jgi:hypothetical protein
MGIAKPDYTTYQYAGALGGPLPFSKKNRFLNNTFFWATEAGYRQAQPLASTTTQYYVPSPAERTGNFSADTVGANPVTLYDPTQPFVDGVRTVVLHGNVIPQNLINPIGQYIVNQFAKPTASGAYNGSTPNYSGSDDFKTRGDEYVGKLDHEFASWWSASASYVHLATQEPGGDLFHTFAASDGECCPDISTQRLSITCLHLTPPHCLPPAMATAAITRRHRNTAMDSTRQLDLAARVFRWATSTNSSRRRFLPLPGTFGRFKPHQALTSVWREL